VCRRGSRNFKPGNEKFVFTERKSFKSFFVWFPACILNQTHHLLIKLAKALVKNWMEKTDNMQYALLPVSDCWTCADLAKSDLQISMDV